MIFEGAPILTFGILREKGNCDRKIDRGRCVVYRRIKGKFSL